ncbi:MAG: metallophosphatase family protein [Solirubrobacteraceae bacterium]|nr:metallophosphatase family protein [Solirubrobacteraceae bacterium]
MRALLYDVHGNLPALEAVLADARSQGAERWLLGGDYALFGGWPVEALDLLGSLDEASWIRGNGERWTADPAQAPDGDVVQGAIAACRELLGRERVSSLAALPPSAPLEGDTRAWHGSPVSDVESFLPEPQPADARLLEGVRETRLVFGHTHLPFARVDAASGVELVNPGSVGMPFDGDRRASYALLHDDGRVEHRRVAYDHGAAAARVRASAAGAPWGETVARRIETASF